MNIIEYEEKYAEDVKDLLVELQEYIVFLDKFKLNIIKDGFREIYFKKTIEEVYGNGGKIFIAVENNKAVAMICGYLEKYTEEDKYDYVCPKKGVISELVVSGKFRSVGTGQKLMDRIEKYFKDLDCEYISVDVFEYNEIAKRFYSKNNYENRLTTMSKKI